MVSLRRSPPFDWSFFVCCAVFFGKVKRRGFHSELDCAVMKPGVNLGIYRGIRLALCGSIEWRFNSFYEKLFSSACRFGTNDASFPPD